MFRYIAIRNEIKTMTRFSRRTITPQIRDAYAQLLEHDPYDDDIARFIRDQYAGLNLDQNQIFQIFQMLVNRQPRFENLENIAQFPNLTRNPNLNIRNRQRNQLHPPPLSPRPAVNIAAAAQQYVDDPFKGNINPGTAEEHGQKI